MKNQGIEHAVLEVQDTSHDNHVIPARVTVLRPALEASRELGEYRIALDARRALESLELVATARREARRQVSLVLGEHMHRKIFCIGERLEIAGFVGDVPKISGGARDTELKLLIVMPTREPWGVSVVTTATPVG